jgi:hypothetical protein
MSLIVTAAQILAAIGADEDDPLEAFAESYRRMCAQGLPVKDIAVRLGISENTVRHRIRRARKAGLLPPANPKFRSAVLAEEFPHGDRAGYLRHMRRGQKPCDGCALANRIYKREEGRMRSQRRREEAA